jgi:sulfur carrier protein ThiS
MLKLVGAATVAAALSLGVASTYAQAAKPVPPPAPAKHHDPSDHALVARAIFESEADVLKLTPQQLRADLRNGQTVADLARAKGMNKDQFAAALNTSLKPRLQALVANHTIIQKQADKIVDRISKGHIPFWNGIHHHKPKPKASK